MAALLSGRVCLCGPDAMTVGVASILSFLGAWSQIGRRRVQSEVDDEATLAAGSDGNALRI